MNHYEMKAFSTVCRRIRELANAQNSAVLSREEIEALHEGIAELRAALDAIVTARDEDRQYRYSSMGFRLLAERSARTADAAVDQYLDTFCEKK